MNTIIDESSPRGKRTFATKNYLPGELILEEQPIAVLTDEQVKAFRKKHRLPDTVSHIPASFSWFQDELSSEEQAQVLTLHGPPTHWDASKIRLNVSPEEKKLLIQFSCIMERNAFDIGNKDRALFAQMSCFGHSCRANCHFSPSANRSTMQCRANQHITAGEELTIAYLPEINLMHTHDRRQVYLEKYHFTCHCPRCDAPGDDTRQFDCFDPACRGVMMVCQPINKEPIEAPNAHYTGVQYVTPHLLPCTVCKRAPPTEYAQENIDVERMFFERIRGFLYEEECAYEAQDKQMFVDMVEYIKEWQFPSRHVVCLPVHALHMRILHATNESIEAYHNALISRGLAYIAAQEAITPHPCTELLDVLRAVCYECVIVINEMAENTGMPCPSPRPQDAKMLLQQNLRMVLLLHGRAVPHDCVWRAEIDKHLLKALAELPPVCNTEVCAFCEESPLRAALTLNRCGKCRKVCYCSTGCQKAHWKLHKKVCGVK